MKYKYRSKLMRLVSFPPPIAVGDKLQRESRTLKHCWIPDQVGNDKQGFTLIEIIVAVSIFTIITLATVDVMIIVMRAQETITHIQALQDNARFSLELMTKEMRTGINYQTGTVCAADGSEIHFTSTSGKHVYYLDPAGSGTIYRATGVDVTNPAQCGIGPGKAFNKFTGDQVFVEHLAFALRGQNPSTVIPSDGQAMVTITMSIQPNLVLETTITQRVRDIL